MKKVLLFSALLVVGLAFSQILPSLGYAPYGTLAQVVKALTMLALSFIMIRVGYEFDLDKSRLRQYGWDYVVAATAAAFPWLFVAFYFLYFLTPPEADSDQAWKEAFLAARFAAPTSAGVLFTMLAAAGLAATWMFRKTRILAIFDDLDTVLLMIPLKIMLVGLKWQLIAALVPMLVLLWLAWRYLHSVRISITWPWVLVYATIITGVCEAVYLFSKTIDELVPVHIEVLLPAFVLGCIIAKPNNGKPDHESAAGHSHDDILETRSEQKAGTIVSACFMVLVGLSMPAIIGVAGSAEAVAGADKAIVAAYVVDGPLEDPVTVLTPEQIDTAQKSMGWEWILFHVMLVTIISNLGKMFPLFCYRKEAHWKQRLAVAVAMFPRGEVGAGVLVISLSYGIGGPIITVALLSLAVNLLCTGFFILVVKKLLA